MRIRVKMCFQREQSAAIQLEFYFQTQDSVSTGELWDLFQPCIQPSDTGFRCEEIDTLIDINTDSREEIATNDFCLHPDGAYYDPVQIYERVFEILAKDSRFDWEV